MLKTIEKNKCPRCLETKPDVLLDQEGEPYLCDECWNEDSPKKKCSCSLPNEKGWHLDEQVFTTNREIKVSEKKLELNVLGWVLNVYCKKGDAGLEALAKHYEAVSDREIEIFCEWERQRKIQTGRKSNPVKQIW